MLRLIEFSQLLAALPPPEAAFLFEEDPSTHLSNRLPKEACLALFFIVAYFLFISLNIRGLSRDFCDTVRWYCCVFFCVKSLLTFPHSDFGLF